MIKFFYGNTTCTDAEKALESVNKYIKLRDNEAYVNYSDENLYQQLLELEPYISCINTGYMINPTISVDSSSKLKQFIKKVIRKLIQWCFNDIVSRQTDFNGLLVQYANAETFLLRSLCDECILLRDENSDLKIHIAEMKKVMEEFENGN